MVRIVLIGCGGFVGSVARYTVSGLLLPWSGGGFPWGTLLVNVSGSLLIGVLMAAAVERQWLSLDLRWALVAGFCGGFTTMSSFSFETWALLEQGQLGLAAGYVATSFVLCVLATALGIALIRLM
ncbi:MAG: fluoride efflux transporter CrcB [Deltaproteobacteria bacterium]|nr:fluoride efflux transporter CrcB [Deltaproteobacteria bacterium]